MIPLARPPVQPTSSDHYFHATFGLFCDNLKSEDGRTEICAGSVGRPSGSITILSCRSM